MRKFVPRRPSPALVVSFVALLVALGGTSYAAFTIPKGSVGTKQIKNGAVTTKKIANGAVTSAKLTSSAFINNAGHANSATNAVNATNGIPRVYGFINLNGTVDTTRSKNIAAATQLGTGSYCVTPSASSGVNPTREFPVASPDEVSGPGIFHAIQFRNLPTLCTTSAGPGWRFDTMELDGTAGPSYQYFSFSLIAP